MTEHQPVLLTEVLNGLNIKKDGRYVDGTLGLGGHAEGVLRHLGPHGKLLGLDVDAGNLGRAKDRLQPFEDQTITRQVNFRGLQEVLREIGWKDVDGMLFDLGVSSPQLEDPQRGFSFQAQGPLDMRLNPLEGESALNLLQRIDPKELEETFALFGERRDARRLSRYLLHDVQLGLIKTTTDLAGFCERVLRRRGKTHPATRVFLALRCLVNKELSSLRQLLDVAPFLLTVGGRLAIISFHSLEDRDVKTRFRDLESNHHSGESPLDTFGNEIHLFRFRRVTKKPVVPSYEESRANPRARSAKLRILERIA